MGKDDVIAHNIRFYNLEARAIHCMALERNKSKLALSRSDNSIEIWDVRFNPVLQKVIFNDTSNSVEDIKWFEDRLFSCGLEGYIVEYDCLKESVKYSVPVTGGPAWCIDINIKKKLLACGTEDGYLNILSIEDEKLEHLKFLDKQQGRILCLCWDKLGQHLITGSMDVIRVWNVDTGHAIHKMKTGRSQNNKETVVWCVAVTSDFTIISGDSRGFLCFWDGKIGTQIESNNSHAADILSLVLTEDESAVYCAGVDPLIAMYGRVLECTGSRRKWAKGGQRKIHEHDVRALAVTKKNKLFSGGIDGYLALSYFPPKVLLKFPPFLKSPSVSLVQSKKFLLLKYLTHLELWKLGQPNINHDTYGSFLLQEKEVQLLQLRAKKNEVIISAAISQDGSFIAYSTEKAIAFFKFSPDEIEPLAKLPEIRNCNPCRLIYFYLGPDKKYFCACVTKKNEIHILEVEESGPDIIHTIRPIQKQVLTDTISHLIVSSDSSFLIAADCQNNIAVWSSSTWELHCSLPKYEAAVTAIALRDKTNLLVVAYSDLKIIEYDLNEKQLTKFSKSLKNFTGYLHTPINSITFDKRNRNGMIIHDDSSICVCYNDDILFVSAGKNKNLCELRSLVFKIIFLLLNCPEGMKSFTVEFEQGEKCWEDSLKSAKLIKTTTEDPADEQQPTFNVVKRSKHIAAISWLDGSEMVIVSVCPLKLTENLPPTLAKKLYGT